MRKDDVNRRAMEAIYRIIDKEKINQTIIADRLGCKPSKLTEILKGRMAVQLDMLSILCEKYDISGDWLLAGIEPIFRSQCRNELDSIRSVLSGLQRRIDALDGKGDIAVAG